MQAANPRYFYELASAGFGYYESKLKSVQAFHFKGGPGAKTGTGGYVPGSKNIDKIAKVRGIEEGVSAISPPTFKDLPTAEDFKHFADRVREITEGIPMASSSVLIILRTIFNSHWMPALTILSWMAEAPTVELR